EPAVMDKFTRAKHAVLAGADVVLEIPTVFACANAEIFATGAFKVLNDLKRVDKLVFGVESGTAEEYVAMAKAMLNETRELKAEIKRGLESGVSPVKARFDAVKKIADDDFDEKLISSPNNILALEYAKAKLKFSSDIELVPFTREGENNDAKLKKGVTSATSVREQLKIKKTRALKKCVPDYVYNDLPEKPYDFSTAIMTRLYTEPASSMAEICDCTEGLENRIKALIKDNVTLNEAVEKISTKRYTLARIKEKLVLKALTQPLYAKVLAVKKDGKEIISDMAKTSTVPLLTRKKDYESVKKTAEEVLKIDSLANDIYNSVSEKKQNEYQMLIV
ncbi:MAG: nucleotidyltransferase family protein, partial [Clostridia bacterium]|nr:nucleotidyltransferase family protein [Clostridia bacterium]